MKQKNTTEKFNAFSSLHSTALTFSLLVSQTHCWAVRSPQKPRERSGCMQAVCWYKSIYFTVRDVQWG